MSDEAVRRAVLAALDSWGGLPPEKKGPGYGETESRLRTWAEELRRKTAPTA